MSTKAQTKPGFFDALNALFGAIFTAATVTERVVKLADNEVSNLEEYQNIRLDNVRAERKANQLALKAL